MQIIVLGAGLIGVCTAYFLQKSGHQVTVIDRQQSSGLETSFANGGQVSVCYSEPWSSMSNLNKIVGWLGKEDSPILFRPSFESKQWIWGLNFLYECLPHRNKQNIRDMLKLSLYSREQLRTLRENLNLNYPYKENGILTFYTTPTGFQAGKEAAKFMYDFGCYRYVQSQAETLTLEPALKNSKLPIFGSDYSEEDESGDAYLFTQQMQSECEKIGVKFLFNHHIMKLNLYDDHITSVSLEHNEQIKNLQAKKFVVAMGSYSHEILKNIGIHTNIYPAKGYSITIPILEQEKVNHISLTDLDYKIVLTNLGNHMRVAGTAEFNGYNLDLNPNRIKALIDRTKLILPEGLDYSKVEAWTGLRPATPGNVPLIGETKIHNLFINSGHGTLGWTMAVGSGKIMEHIINNGFSPLDNVNK